MQDPLETLPSSTCTEIVLDRPMHDATVVPQDQVSRPPVLKMGKTAGGCVALQLFEEFPSLVIWEPLDSFDMAQREIQ